MPPWPPDTAYTRFSHERILTQTERQAIIDWVNNGAPQGNPALTPPVPLYPTGSALGTPDLALQIPTYTSMATSVDEYHCFTLQTGLSQTRYIKAMEVIPGNPAIVHHVLVYVDTSNVINSGNCGGLNGNSLKLIGGFVPGSSPTIFPHGGNTNMGIALPAGKNIVVQIHYPKATAGEVDSTKVNFFFYTPALSVRPLSVDPLIQNWSLLIPANTVKTYNAQFPSGSQVIPGNYSIVGVMPHMHLLGQSMVVFAKDFFGDTIPLIRINNWDFHWQGFYQFSHMVKIPLGSRIYAKAVYDNTVNNPDNPNNPPQLVTAGEQTTDEMFMAYFQYLPYQTGDELLDLDTMTSMPLTVKTTLKEEILASLMLVPNPLSNETSIQYGLPESGQLQIKVLDVTGREIMTAFNGYQQEGIHSFALDASLLPEGIYLVRLIHSGTALSKKMLVSRRK